MLFESDDRPARDDAMMKALYWWGPATLFRCAHEPDPHSADIALVGVPHSSGNGSTERDQHLGPRAVRNVSAAFRRWHPTLDVDPWDALRINDLGDVPLPEGNNNERSIQQISEFIETIAAAGAYPVSIGGDHSITGAIVRGLVRPHPGVADGGPVALIHFDAHTDSYDAIDHWYGAVDSAAHWAGFLAREGCVDPSRSVQIGMRGYPRGPEWAESSEKLGYEVVPIARYRALGPQACLDLIRQRVQDAPAYVTFDLDCLDPTVAPGVSNPEPGFGGWTTDEAFHLLRGLQGLNIVGGDVVCLMPTKDSPNGVTAMVAAATMFELIALIGDRLLSNTEG